MYIYIYICIQTGVLNKAPTVLRVRDPLKVCRMALFGGLGLRSDPDSQHRGPTPPALSLPFKNIMAL